MRKRVFALAAALFLLMVVPSVSASAAYGEDELCRMARQYYEAKYGYSPQYVEGDSIKGDMVVLHLYDFVGGHISTVDWYSIDRRTGKGSSTITGEQIDLSPYSTSPGSIPFTDVKHGDWYYDSVEYAYESGLFSGTDSCTFSPGQPMSRAMLVTVLYRLEGQPAIPDSYYGVSFSDVLQGQYYTKGVKWAGSRGLVRGTGEKTFSPHANITREQLATMLYRYAVSYGGMAPVSASLADFVDADAVSRYAQDAIEWCVKNGIITGKDGSRLDPGGQATQAQVAAMLLRLSKLPEGDGGYRAILDSLTDTDVFYFDLEGDGTEEAFVTHRQGQSETASVYTRRTGAVVPLLEGEEIYMFVSSFDGGIGVVERHGQLFVCIRQSHVGNSHPSYRYSGFYKLYKMAGGSLTLAEDVEYDLRIMAGSTAPYQTEITQNGYAISYPAYQTWVDGLRWMGSAGNVGTKNEKYY